MRFPITAHGKIDRAALPGTDRVGHRSSRAPQGRHRAARANWFGELLGGRDRVGADDSFFDLGLAANGKLVAAVRNAFGVDVGVQGDRIRHGDRTLAGHIVRWIRIRRGRG